MPAAGVSGTKEACMGIRKIGRDAETGKFKPVKEAQQDKKGSIVETIKGPAKPPSPPKKK